MAAGYSLGSGLFIWSALQNGHKIGPAFKVLSLMLLGALLGSKLFHVLFEAYGHIGPDGQLIHNTWELLQADPWHALRFDDPGYVFYGGLLGALILAWRYQDFSLHAVKGLSLGLCIGRIGCFFTGCCYGIANLPVQLYEAGFALWLLFKAQSLGNWLWAYAIWRFFIEFLRADSSRGIWALGLSSSQWISAILLALLAGRALTRALKSSQIHQTRIQV